MTALLPSPGRRRFLLASAALLLGASGGALGRSIQGGLPWTPFAADPPRPFRPGPWQYFTLEEAQAVEAAVERLIPRDEFSMSGKEAGCAEFIDRQLAGPYGRAERAYMRAPFQAGTPEQGFQQNTTPAMTYRRGLASLDTHCRERLGGRGFAELPPEERDRLLAAMEKGEAGLRGVDEKLFFDQLLGNTMEGFFADPIHGGNRDMVSWKMLGFPGTRYDFRDFVDRHNQKLDLPPVSIAGRAGWIREG
ncbi:gluconate 2-dehydrogenase subunit 3 family protein [Roseomonas sp. KE0001]|uniref:gluconate 2-dehydrogenase subunit 3 family protein n=1 Tax=Roseomonas sp. KE0001 TaxID=2479201 RepID=UPI0018DF87F3|nr:gluconate 2-dehydrogenase subunit 3 family protein [Roseomonas sp. KE0001]MBI0432431.1 gluconate 2-dehydrogenase subunit 3 family protein [Roseomonas sp. KE0001]